jgi:hypothetical protein
MIEFSYRGLDSSRTSYKLLRSASDLSHDIMSTAKLSPVVETAHTDATPSYSGHSVTY